MLCPRKPGHIKFEPSDDYMTGYKEAERQCADNIEWAHAYIELLERRLAYCRQECKHCNDECCENKPVILPR